jgi:hypothetical protein
MNIVVLRLCIQCGRPEREGEKRKITIEHARGEREREKEEEDCPIFFSVLSLFLS